MFYLDYKEQNYLYKVLPKITKDCKLVVYELEYHKWQKHPKFMSPMRHWNKNLLLNFNIPLLCT